jgi:hypothetical protein
MRSLGVPDSDARHLFARAVCFLLVMGHAIGEEDAVYAEAGYSENTP